MIIRNYLEFDVVEHCNLRCDGCAHFSPYMEPQYSNLEEFRNDIDVLSSAMHVKTFRLLGGEPLLHQDIHEFIKTVKSSGISDTVGICSNGKLVNRISEEMFSDIDYIHISQYPGTNIDYSEVDKILKENSIKHNFIYSSTFRGRFNIINSDVENMNANEVQWIFDTCKMAHIWGCHTFKNGRYYKCVKPYYQNKYFKRTGIKDNIDFKLLDGIDLHLPYLLERLQAYLDSTTPLKSCSFCFGSTDVKESIISRQLSKQEISNKISHKK